MLLLRCVAVVLLLAGCAGGTTDDGDETVSVVADLFSGRPNPQWQLDAPRTATTVACLSGASSGPVAGPADGPLGFRGFVLTGLPAAVPFREVTVTPDRVIGLDASGRRLVVRGCESLYGLLRVSAAEHLEGTDVAAIPQG